MKDLSIKAVVTSADGFYYREEHEWRGMPEPEKADGWFQNKAKEIAKLAAKVAASTKEDGDVLTAKLDSVIDGTPQPQFVVANLSYSELAKFQDIWDDWAKELGTERRKRVNAKQEKHRKGRGGDAGRGRDRDRDR